MHDFIRLFIASIFIGSSLLLIHLFDSIFIGNSGVILGTVDSYGHLIVSRLDTSGEGTFLFCNFVKVGPML